MDRQVAGRDFSGSFVGYRIDEQLANTGDAVTVTGSIDIVFADYGVTPPTSFIAVSVEDHGVIEFQLHFRQA